MLPEPIQPIPLVLLTAEANSKPLHQIIPTNMTGTQIPKISVNACA